MKVNENNFYDNVNFVFNYFQIFKKNTEFEFDDNQINIFNIFVNIYKGYGLNEDQIDYINSLADDKQTYLMDKFNGV